MLPEARLAEATEAAEHEVEAVVVLVEAVGGRLLIVTSPVVPGDPVDEEHDEEVEFEVVRGC